jgi:hypothetical protein
LGHRDPEGESEWRNIILCGFSVDIDAVAGWFGSYGGEDSPSDIQRGMFAGKVGGSTGKTQGIAAFFGAARLSTIQAMCEPASRP